MQTDQELAAKIAAFVASHGVTECPPGHAAGTSAMERAFYAAPPPQSEKSNWANARRVAAQRKKARAQS